MPRSTSPRSVRRRDYVFKTEPRAHQRTAFELARSKEYFALLMEMGTGKTKTDIDCTAYAVEQGLIDAWLIVAPSGVHLNWVRQELPKHWPDRLAYNAIEWDSPRARNKSFQDRLRQALTSTKALPIISMNIDAVLTDPGIECLRTLLRTRKCKVTIDESSIIKNPKAQRTKVMMKVAKLATQRRILNGTPVTTGPLNLYSQCRFLHEDIFGFGSYYAFAHHFAEWSSKRNWAQGRDYEELVGYRNLEELTSLLAPHSFRVTKDECLDLPPKVYLPPRYVELTKEQRKLYEELRDEFLIELEGERITATLAITRLLRLQQLICGYLPSSDEGKLLAIPGPNNRLAEALAVVEERDPKKMILWARFRPDVAQLAAALSKKYGRQTVAVYDGTVKQEDRDRAKVTFQDPDSPVRFFVGNPAVGARGLDLYAAELTYYYSNSFSNEQRWQSEDRAHRDGLKHTAVYGDLVAADTVDEQIIESLRSGRDVADDILGRLPLWLK